MNDETRDLESELAAMRPASLDAALMERLENAIEGRARHLAPAERAFEEELRRVEPAALGEARHAALASVLERIPFPGGSKVVPFPNAPSARPKPSRARRSWAAAAAVALAGGLTAIFMGPSSGDAPEVAEAVRPTRAVDAAAFSPAGFESDVSDTRDLGRMWNGGPRAMRVVQVVYTDKVTFLNAEGEEVTIERPRVEYVMMPQEVD